MCVSLSYSPSLEKKKRMKYIYCRRGEKMKAPCFTRNLFLQFDPVAIASVREQERYSRVFKILLHPIADEDSEMFRRRRGEMSTVVDIYST